MAGEAEVLARYLLGGSAPVSVVQRYEDLLPKSGLNDPDRITTFAIRFPFALYFLDPGCGWFKPKAQLRKKLQMMSAILECEPQLAAEFIDPPDTHLLLLVLRSCWSGLRAIPGGLLLLFL